MRMRRSSLAVLVCTIALALGWTGCDEQPTSPPEAGETEAQAATEDSDDADLEARIERLINGIFPSGQARSDANDTFSDIKSALAQDDTDEARSQMFDFVDGLLEKARAGELQDPEGERIGPETAREGAAELTRLYFWFVGFEAPQITAGALAESGAADVVSPDEGAQVKTGDGKGGVDIPPGRLEEPALVTMERRKDPATVGDAPIPQDFQLAPHPPFYDVETTTQPTDDGVMVGICVPETGPLAPEADLQDDLRVVRKADGTEQPEFLPAASADFVDCGTDEIAVAGKTSGFSTFGGGTSPDAVSLGTGDFRGLESCAVREDGQAFCWGLNDWGQLGIGGTTGPETCVPDRGSLPEEPCSKTPVAVDQSVNGGVSFSSVDGGSRYNCALDSSGQAYCWGKNGSGQLGDGTTTTRTTPVPVDQPLDFTAISAGSSHTCGLDSSGQAYCWGANGYGQLGDGTTTARSTPVEVDQSVDGGISFDRITAGFRYTCGLATNGQAYCWGYGLFAQLGDGGTSSRQLPTPVDQSMDGGVTFAEVEAGAYATCALTSGGQAYCWGGNFRGLVGNGADVVFKVESLPVAVDQSVSFSAIRAGSVHNCALDTGDQAYCWGNALGVGDGSTGSQTSPVPVDQTVDGGIGFTDLDPGHANTCAITTAGEVYCWGQNRYGSVGDGTNTTRRTPVRVE